MRRTRFHVYVGVADPNGEVRLFAPREGWVQYAKSDPSLSRSERDDAAARPPS